jgi:hypothetical protein
MMSEIAEREAEELKQKKHGDESPIVEGTQSSVTDDYDNFVSIS